MGVALEGDQEGWLREWWTQQYVMYYEERGRDKEELLGLQDLQMKALQVPVACIHIKKDLNFKLMGT